MALDTQQKRMSAMTPGCPWRGPSVLPTGTIGQAQRQATAYLYSGILAALPQLEPIYPRSVTLSRQGVGGATVNRQGVGSVTVSRQGVGSVRIAPKGN